MYISQAELAQTQIPPVWRDYCSHLLKELYACRSDNYYLPWRCGLEKVAWSKCEYDDFLRRRSVLAGEQRAAALAASSDKAGVTEGQEEEDELAFLHPAGRK
jgi:NADH dehydrogenase (ubiquinone) 1 beta subcomplex subunit 7